MKALIVYGTRWGGTTGVAEKIAETLRGEGADAEVFEAKKAPRDIDEYDLVVVGSGLMMGRWTKETQGFLKRNADKLKHKKTALFVSCGTVEEEDGIETARRDFLEKVAQKHGLTPIALGAFGGVYDTTKNLGIIGNIAMSAVKKGLTEKGVDMSKPYDFRDWDNITKWSTELLERS